MGGGASSEEEEFEDPDLEDDGLFGQPILGQARFGKARVVGADRSSSPRGGVRAVNSRHHEFSPPLCGGENSWWREKIRGPGSCCGDQGTSVSVPPSRHHRRHQWNRDAPSPLATIFDMQGPRGLTRSSERDTAPERLESPILCGWPFSTT